MPAALLAARSGGAVVAAILPFLANLLPSLAVVAARAAVVASSIERRGLPGAFVCVRPILTPSGTRPVGLRGPILCSFSPLGLPPGCALPGGWLVVGATLIRSAGKSLSRVFVRAPKRAVRSSSGTRAVIRSNGFHLA